MNNLLPEYRVLLNKNLLVNPLFLDYLRISYTQYLMNTVTQGRIDLSIIYKFTILMIPPQWGTQTMQTIRKKSIEGDEKYEKISDILLSLDPLNPNPVDVEFTLGEIISFVTSNLHHFQEVQLGGVLDYFGIETQLWFNDYPIQTGSVIKAVDFGNLDNPPFHLFDTSFVYLRNNLLDLFAQFVEMNRGLETRGQVITNVDI